MIQERKITLEVPDVQEALNEASRQWKLPVEDLHAEILSTERDGFLGLFGSKKIRVEVTANARPDIMARGLEFVGEILRLMDFDAHPAMSETERNMIDIQGDDAADYVVGRYGDALKGLEYIVNLALRDPKTEPRIKIDSCGYRERRTKSLERLAEATARQAVKFGRPVRLDPMASWERWVIHTTLKNRSDVTTESVGESPSRKVVVIPKFEPEEVRMPGPATLRVRVQRELNEKAGARNPAPQSRYPRRRNRNRRDTRRDDTATQE
ncbi:MAG: Jag N-terminal domain-containing protein [Synergistaceae bacterium]|nr:Jag N-terminal domain-containing protein [Synergistaceae bacterium]